MAMTLSSAAFTHDGVIARRHTCDGEDVSPPWLGMACPLVRKAWR